MKIQYQHPNHDAYPHVVKFSGGRSSAMMLMMLLESNQLNASRGDVIIFNNTSAEHIKTYEFVVKCKNHVEQNYQIPFFLIEFQTYEDAWLGRWRRAATYRMVKPYPSRKFINRKSYGYRHQGEAFKEFVSWNAQLPTRFSRTCTEYLKLHTSAKFLEDWFGRCGGNYEFRNKNNSSQTSRRKTNPRLGHHYTYSQILNSCTDVPRSIKAQYHLEQISHREAQHYQHYTQVPLTDYDNETIGDYVFDFKANLREPYPLKFVTLVGLRADEPIRVVRTLARNNSPDAKGRVADGEFVYAPLFEAGIDKQDVFEFWKNQTFDLDIDHDVNLSNCVFCFMKGEATIRELAKHHSYGNGPGNIEWWADFEAKYSNQITRRDDENLMSIFGFFGVNALTYQNIADNLESSSSYEGTGFLPCECTD